MSRQSQRWSFTRQSWSLKGSERFYRDELGLQVIAERRSEGLVFLGAPDNLADPSRDIFPLERLGPPGLWPEDEEYLANKGPGLSYLCFAAEDVDAVHTRLTSAGVPCTTEPMDIENTRIALFTDPDGIHFEILRPVEILISGPG